LVYSYLLEGYSSFHCPSYLQAPSDRDKAGAQNAGEANPLEADILGRLVFLEKF
jgi:hypothetical protein